MAGGKMKLKEAFYEFISKYQFPYIEKEVDNVYQSCIEINTEKGLWDGFITIYEEDKIFIFTLNMGVKVPDDKMTKIQCYLAELSGKLKVGGFSIDPELGMLVCRCGQFAVDGGETKLMERVIFACVQIAQEYFEEIMYKIFN